MRNNHWPWVERDTIKLLSPLSKSRKLDEVSDKGPVDMKEILKYIDLKIEQKVQPYMDKIETLEKE